MNSNKSLIKLSAKTRMSPHYGYNPSSNHILRSHFGIIVPENCGLMVDNEIKVHKEKEWITFDDSKLHFAWNNSKSDRYVLLIDLERPKFIAVGNSQREKDENILYEYIELFRSK
jgi:beta-hydroxylase